jgi:hypothetical protein
MYEHELYYIEKEIAAYNNISLPEALKLDFNEPEYPMTVQDQIALDNHRLNLGLVNKAELMVEYNKDLTIEEANAKLQENEAQIEPQNDRSQV